MRALTLSTHTRLEPWWQLFNEDRPAYERRKTEYNRRMIEAAERAFPGIKQGLQLQIPGTPVTFQRFTKRSQGWVGGFPQTNLFRTWPSRLAKDLYMVGDSIFPGQSTAAVALGGLRVGQQVLAELSGRSAGQSHHRVADFTYS
jgi:phytoene dehydrogenase-like protein